MKAFRLLTVLIMAVVCVGLSSCSKDDDSSTLIDNSPDINLLYGTWSRDYYWYEWDNSKTPWKEVFTFKNDNTWSSTEYEDGKVHKTQNGTFVYYKDARTLALTIKGEDEDFIPTYYILELKENTLTWDLGDDGAFTFTRQK